ncbi:hypothetical protein HanXRQr2_Chr09g0369111 [Helianthus annuus]|uniref:Uncharacterized protein n=1 Tax=Helianthus annuus TaxID=4232 RepID=A0A251USV9_HELAN|nr:hypothetical protein HanXRQr2_Chr09g0369111 [Helianthus annuus]
MSLSVSAQQVALFLFKRFMKMKDMERCIKWVFIPTTISDSCGLDYFHNCITG